VAAQSLPKAEKDRAYSDMRKKGIFELNKQHLGDKTCDILRERKTKSDNSEVVMCGYCHGFYSKPFFHRHKSKCTAAEASGNAVSVPFSVAVQHDPEDDFCQSILAKFQPDAVGKICQTTDLVIAVGRHLYSRRHRKPSKYPDTRKSCMRDMRRLASLFLAFQAAGAEDGKVLAAEDMLHRKYFSYLESAVTTLSTNPEETDLKAGTKLGLGYIIKKAAKVMKVQYLIADDDEKARSVDNFVTVLELQWPSLFGDAEYKVISDRQQRLRKPAELPVEEDVARVRQYMLEAIAEIAAQEYLFWTSSEFSVLRNLVVARLTLFNARRGGEPSRLLLREWQDAENDVWLPNSAIDAIQDPAEQVLVGKFKIAYQAGKGKQHLVSLLIPNDCIDGMKILCSAEVRASSGVCDSNPFVFAYTQKSNDHVSGWHAISDVCQKAGLTTRITATEMRHRVSTYYASLEVPEAERKYFYMHMGHSEAMNMNVYQCPMAVAAVIKVGKHLINLDSAGMKFDLIILLLP